MPYSANRELPPAVRLHLPEHAQDIFRKAFNSAWRNYGASQASAREEIAFRVAWAAVKRRYQKIDGVWVEK